MGFICSLTSCEFLANHHPLIPDVIIEVVIWLAAAADDRVDHVDGKTVGSKACSSPEPHLLSEALRC